MLSRSVTPREKYGSERCQLVLRLSLEDSIWVWRTLGRLHAHFHRPGLAAGRVHVAVPAGPLAWSPGLWATPLSTCSPSFPQPHRPCNSSPIICALWSSLCSLTNSHSPHMSVLSGCCPFIPLKCPPRVTNNPSATWHRGSCPKALARTGFSAASWPGTQALLSLFIRALSDPGLNLAPTWVRRVGQNARALTPQEKPSTNKGQVTVD